MDKNPVLLLNEFFIDNLGEDWEFCPDPEVGILGVPSGTVADLLYQIRDLNLWGQLYAIALSHSDQWMLDLSDFFPHEEDFVQPLAEFLFMARTEHAKACFAQEASDWCWGEKNFYLLPKVIVRVQEVGREMLTSGQESIARNLKEEADRLNLINAGSGLI